ncbi:MAG: Wzz/FepE/Etk N-terminal domain-containing protein [Pseudomonadota bacterium]
MALNREANIASLSPQDHDRSSRDRKRVFLLVALPVLLAGLAYTVLQPAVYESSATVLMSAPTAIDEQVLTADVQSVAIQRRKLTGPEILSALVERMSSDYGITLKNLELRRMLRVAAVPQTNLLELTARSPEEAILPSLVDSWIDVYADIRASEIESRHTRTLNELESELDGLARQLDDARRALADYREKNDIISMDRQENAVLARLDGLNEALNSALEEEILAGSRLQTLQTALDAGEPVVPSTERGAVTAMEQQLTSLLTQLSGLRTRYTDDYILKDPRLRGIPQQISDLERALAEAYSAGAQAELAAAARTYEAARQAARDLEASFEEQKQEVAAFSTVFAKHEALVEDLAQLEDVNREKQARLAQIQIRPTDGYPQLDVVTWPDTEATRIGPPYPLLLGGTLGASLLAAIFAVWLYSYLNPVRKEPAYVTLSGVHLFPGDGAQVLEQGAVAVQLPSEAGATHLGIASPKSQALEPSGDERVDQESEPETPPRNSP